VSCPSGTYAALQEKVVAASGRRSLHWRSLGFLGLALCALVVLVLGRQALSASASQGQSGAVVRVGFKAGDVDSLDPALSYAVASWMLLDTTCALLVRPGGGSHAGSGLQPEVVTGLPRVSHDGKTLTFTLRSGFRFSNGAPVRASAFVRAINRTLAPEMKSPWADYLRDIVGAEQVIAGKAEAATGAVDKGNTLVIRLRRRVADFLPRTTFLCAVPPTLPIDAEGIGAFHAAGPYYVAEHRPGERALIRRNRFYGGARERHVEGFDVDLRASSHEEVLDRIERGEVDWGWVLSPFYFDPSRRLAARYGVNRSQFFLRPGFTFRGYAFNTSRPLFRNNPRLRRAVSFAIDRSAFRRAAGGELSSRLTDQYLPPAMRGFRDARIYPLHGPDLPRARALAQGHTRGGKALLYTIDMPNHVSFAQSIKQNLAKIGLEVRIKAVPLQAYFGGLMANGPYDLGFATWTPDYGDPYAVLNVQLEGRFIGAWNWPRFASPEYDRLLRSAARLEGAARYRAYGKLDVKIARDAAPMVAIDYPNDPLLVSKRLGCVAGSFDLAAVCLK
jgi:ABC-type transport system substrate-binding protein